MPSTFRIPTRSTTGASTAACASINTTASREKTGIEPRFGGSYLIKKTGTVLRGSYSRTMETPYNENLLLSSASGVGGLASNVFGAYGSVAASAGYAQPVQHSAFSRP